MDFALSNFLESQKTFTERLFESVKSNIKDLKLYQIVNSLDFLKKIDADFNIDDVLDQCIDQFIEAGGKFDSDEKLGSHFPDYVVEKIKQRLGEKQETYSIPELMDRLAGSDSWNTVDIAKMEPFTEDDYFKWMTSDEDENLLMKIKIFTHRFGENETEKLIICRINSALEKISNRSQLDRIRVENIIGYKKD